MKLTKPGPTRQQSKPNKNGYVLIIIVLILASVFSIVLVKMTIQSIVFLNTSSLIISQANLSALEKSCAQENLILLSRNPEYAGGTIPLLNGTCASTITPNGDYKNILINVTLAENTDSITITFDQTIKRIVVWDN